MMSVSIQEIGLRIGSGQMDEEEQKVLRHLQDHQEELVAAYLASLEKARRSILERLAASLLREDLLGLATTSHDLQVIGSICAINVPSLDESWRKTIERLYTYGLQSGTTYKLYPLASYDYLVFPISRWYAYRRPVLEGDILHVGAGGVSPLRHAAELISLLEGTEAGRGYDWGKLAEEVRNGTANLALAYACWAEKKARLRKQAEEAGVDSTMDWVLRQRTTTPGFDASLFFEQLCVEGHNLHPGAKTKMGMEPQDVLRYAPECDGTAELRLVAIRQDRAKWVTAEDALSGNEALFQAFPEVEEAVRREWADKGLSLERYTLVPVHPWQLEHAIPTIYREELEQGIVLPVDRITIPCGSTSSFRTVVPLHDHKRQKLAIKAAVNSQMTSTMRSISPQTARNAPEFTRLIREILRREPELSATFQPVCEVAGVHFITDGETDSTVRTLKSRNLTAVLRESVESFTTEDELAIVGSALYAESPISGKPILAELVEHYAASIGEVSLREAACRFVKEYISVAVPGYLTLMVKYGIALEGHMQNSVPVFRQGRPVRMLFRDWGGARIYRKRLEQQGMPISFFPGSVTVTDRLQEMHNKLYYTLFQNHLGEIVQQVCRTFGAEERELWREVRRSCDSVFERLRAVPHWRENVEQDERALYQPQVEHKALTLMRLLPDEKGYAYADVPNPLHAP
jgi:siderophore synthetase component